MKTVVRIRLPFAFLMAAEACDGASLDGPDATSTDIVRHDPQDLCVRSEAVECKAKPAAQ